MSYLAFQFITASATICFNTVRLSIISLYKAKQTPTIKRNIFKNSRKHLQERNCKI